MNHFHRLSQEKVSTYYLAFKHLVLYAKKTCPYHNDRGCLVLSLVLDLEHFG